MPTSSHPGLDERDLDPDPFRQFDRWFADAAGAGLAQPEAMALATSSPDGRPSVRMVLLKASGPDGFVYYTHHGSAKGRDVESNPLAAVTFYWYPLHRQVRASGRVERVSLQESDRYFATRPRGARLAALASRQSEVIPDRETLMQEFERLAERYPGEDVPRPETWGGYRLVPDQIEFWQGREDRLHDRLRYAREPGGGWRIERLSP